MRFVTGHEVDQLVVVSLKERPLYMWINHLLFGDTLWTHLYWLMLKVRQDTRYGIIVSINNKTGEKLAWKITQKDMVSRGEIDPLKSKDGKLPVISSLEETATAVIHKGVVDFRMCLTPEEIMQKVEECGELGWTRQEDGIHTFYAPLI